MNVEVKQLSDEELKKLNVKSWPIWTKEESEFEWFYSDKESCYIIEGDVDVSYNNKQIHFKAGDFVIFPKGLNCFWKINKAVKKYYNFG